MTDEHNPGEGINLSDDEVQSLAWYMAGQLLIDAGDAWEWEDVPLLTEDCYERVIDAIVARGQAMCRSADPPGGHDGAELLGRVR